MGRPKEKGSAYLGVFASAVASGSSNHSQFSLPKKAAKPRLRPGELGKQPKCGPNLLDWSAVPAVRPGIARVLTSSRGGTNGWLLVFCATPGTFHAPLDVFYLQFACRLTLRTHGSVSLERADKFRSKDGNSALSHSARALSIRGSQKLVLMRRPQSPETNEKIESEPPNLALQERPRP